MINPAHYETLCIHRCAISAATQSLIDGCVAAKIPVVQILHTEDKGAFAHVQS